LLGYPGVVPGIRDGIENVRSHYPADDTRRCGKVPEIDTLPPVEQSSFVWLPASLPVVIYVYVGILSDGADAMSAYCSQFAVAP
jgi:hypothetical protein